MSDTTTTQDNRPQMTEKELTFHTTVARIRARKEAANEGGDPAAISAIANAAIGGIRVGGLHIKPLGPGTLWALQKLGSVYASSAGGAVTTEEICIAAYVFAFPEDAWALLDAGKEEQLTREAAGLAFNLSMPEFKEINAFIATEFKQLEAAAGNEPDDVPGKPRQAPAQTPPPSSPHPAGTSAPSPSSGTPAPPPDGQSPSSSSSSRNTPTPCKKPSSAAPSPPPSHC